MTFSSMTAWKAPYGVQNANLPLVADWMTCSVHLPPWRALCVQRRRTASLFTVFLIMKKLEAVQSRGAASTFLKDTLLRIHNGLGRTYEEYLMTLADSFMISADNAHALHPNYADMTDPVNHPLLNEGIVIKYNANQKYCTDAVSAAFFKDLCDRAEVPYQTFVNRSDMAGGSTLGNISNTQVPMNTVDIGLPQLSMHSPYETAGVKDTSYFIKVAEEFLHKFT